MNTNVENLNKYTDVLIEFSADQKLLREGNHFIKNRLYPLIIMKKRTLERSRFLGVKSKLGFTKIFAVYMIKHQ